MHRRLAGIIKVVGSGAPLANIRALLVADSGVVVAQDTTHSSGTSYLLAQKAGHYNVLFVSDSLQFLVDAAPVDLMVDSTVQKEYLLAVQFRTRPYSEYEVDRPAHLIDNRARLRSARPCAQ